MNIQKTFNAATVNAITHPAPHHADEVFATAMLDMLHPVELFRTRDQAIIDSADAIIYDVGNKFSPEERRFDHHQKGFSEARPDGTIYSSVGLIWREYGSEIVKKIGGAKVIDDDMAAEVVSKVDSLMIRGIDARDNGQSKEEGFMSVSAMIADMNTLWDEDEDPDGCFQEACEIAGKVLRRTIKVVISSVCGRKLIADQIKTAEGAVLVMDRYIGGWIEEIVTSDDPKATNLLYAVFHKGDWNVQAIPPTIHNMTAQRKPFPESWRGLRDEKLAKVSGVETAVFCHAAGFFAVAKTKEDAILLAEKAAAF